MRSLLLVALAALVAACGPEPILSCEAVGNARPVCKFQNPEDLAVLPDGKRVLVSEFGAMDGSRPGRLSFYDPATDTRRLLYQGGDGGKPPGEPWGDTACPGPPPPAFSPHGIDLARRPDGRLALLVVNHGGRESIELFEVLEKGPTLTWRGCILPPLDSYLNDVAALPDGGLVTSHMFERSYGMLRLAVAWLFGDQTGYALEWHRDRGFSRVPGSEDRFPNGIAVARDGKSIYLNASMAGTVRRIDRATGRELAVARVPAPDNVTWANGRLLVASMRAPFLEVMACSRLREGACPSAFAIVALDPETLAQEQLYANEGAPMGAGTGAVQVSDELLIGSFAGDRLLRVRLEPAVAATR